MDLALVTLQQVGILFILIVIGYVCGKTGVVTSEGKKVLSNFLIKAIVPAMIVNAYLNMEFNPQILTNLLQAFGLSFGSIFFAMLVSWLLLWKMKTPNKKMLWFAWSYSNAAYMGFPLVKGLFGDEGMLYASAFATVFNIVVWSIGYAVMSGESNGKKIVNMVVKSPVTCSVVVGLLLYLCRIPVPEILKQPIRMIGETTTPISMIIIGVMIAESRLKSILANKEIWLTVVVRLVLIPTLTFGLFYLFGIGGMVGSVILIQAASPTAATTSVLAAQFNHNESIGAGTVVITTICSIVTLTIFVLLLPLL